MKQLLFNFRLLALPLALGAGLIRPAHAQTAERRTSLGLNVSALQYQGNFGSDYWNFANNRYAPGLAINQYLGRGIDLNTQLFYGELTGRRNAANYFTTNVVNVNAGFKFKLNNGWALKESAFIQPYLLASGGWTYASRVGLRDGERIDLDKGYVDVFGAAGLNFRLGGGVSLFVQTGQHLPMFANFDGTQEEDGPPRWADRFLQHTVGLTFNLGQAADADDDGVPDRRDRCSNTPAGTDVDEYGCPPDGDQDGVADYQDQCPTEVGKAELQGCPDRDNDDVPDGDDACPDTPGKTELGGCPDADSDGVIDQDDKCPDTPAGTAVDASGCPNAPATTPAADTDNDGVPNEADRCPTSPGPASNRGCPEIKAETRQRLQEATKFISFELNQATLLPSSYPTLDNLVQILSEYPDYTLSIAGHTDSKGPAAYNLRLSRDRAAAARAYMLSKGVADARIELRGYGAQQPLTDNATDAGRALNRRVEFDLFLTGDRNAAEVKYGPEPTSLPTAPAPRKAVKAAAPRKTTAKATTRKPTARKTAPAKRPAQAPAPKRAVPQAVGPKAKDPAAAPKTPRPAARPATTRPQQ
ncbi:hypothetical protein GCM10027048_28960 [Hymenobacter coalescens]